MLILGGEGFSLSFLKHISATFPRSVFHHHRSLSGHCNELRTHQFQKCQNTVRGVMNKKALMKTARVCCVNN